MSESGTETELVARAKSGDRLALQQLLLLYASRLSRYIAPKLPASVQCVLSPEDIVQQTFLQVFRDIDQFEFRPDGSFLSWLKTLADHRTQDAVKSLKRMKRGGDRMQLHRAAGSQSRSYKDLVDMLSVGSHTPSRSVAGHEAVRAVRDTMARLPEDYRQAVQLRLLEGRSLKEVAEAMERTPRAVQGLIDRAKTKMRADLGRLSLYQ